MRAHFLLIIFFWATWGLAQVADRKTTPQVKNVLQFEVTSITNSPGGPLRVILGWYEVLVLPVKVTT